MKIPISILIIFVVGACKKDAPKPIVLSEEKALSHDFKDQIVQGEIGGESWILKGAASNNSLLVL